MFDAGFHRGHQLTAASETHLAGIFNRILAAWKPTPESLFGFAGMINEVALGAIGCNWVQLPTFRSSQMHILEAVCQASNLPVNSRVDFQQL